MSREKVVAVHSLPRILETLRGEEMVQAVLVLWDRDAQTVTIRRKGDAWILLYHGRRVGC
jgi:hypothetical protein